MERFHQGLTGASELGAPSPHMNWKKDPTQERVSKISRVFEDELSPPDIQKLKSSLSVAFNLPKEKESSTATNVRGRPPRNEGVPNQIKSLKQSQKGPGLNPSKMMETLSAEKPPNTGVQLPSSVEERLRALFATPEGTSLKKSELSQKENERSSRGGEDRLLPSMSQNVRFTHIEEDEHRPNLPQDKHRDTSEMGGSSMLSAAGKKGEVQLQTISEHVSIVNKSVDKDSTLDRQAHQLKSDSTFMPTVSPEPVNSNIQLRATAMFGDPKLNGSEHVQAQSGVQISNSSKAESQRRTIENIDNDFSRDYKFSPTEEPVPMDLPQMTESSVMRPSALPDEDDGILSREIFAALESFQKLTRDQPGFQSKLEQKVNSLSQQSNKSSQQPSRKPSLPNTKQPSKVSDTKHHLSAEKKPKPSKPQTTVTQSETGNFKKTKTLPPKDPTKFSIATSATKLTSRFVFE